MAAKKTTAKKATSQASAGADAPADDVVVFDISELTLRETIEAEKAMHKFTGDRVVFTDMFANGAPSAAAIAAFVYAIKKRTDPDFTFDDALDVKIEQLGAGAGPDPTGAAS